MRESILVSVLLSVGFVHKVLDARVTVLFMRGVTQGRNHSGASFVNGRLLIVVITMHTSKHTQARPHTIVEFATKAFQGDSPARGMRILTWEKNINSLNFYDN